MEVRFAGIARDPFPHLLFTLCRAVPVPRHTTCSTYCTYDNLETHRSQRNLKVMAYEITYHIQIFALYCLPWPVGYMDVCISTHPSKSDVRSYTCSCNFFLSLSLLKNLPCARKQKLHRIAKKKKSTSNLLQPSHVALSLK